MCREGVPGQWREASLPFREEPSSGSFGISMGSAFAAANRRTSSIDRSAVIAQKVTRAQAVVADWCVKTQGEKVS